MFAFRCWILALLLATAGCDGNAPHPLLAETSRSTAGPQSAATVEQEPAAATLAASSQRPHDATSHDPTTTPNEIPANEPPDDERRYERHLEELRGRLPTDDDFHVVVSKPFVVIGNDQPSNVSSWAEGTVAWATRMLKQDYFERDPAQIIDVWLFRDRASYEKYNLQLFGSRPTTPFGYYSAEHRALVMNISTGGGTLVHEIVHPFIAANFPQCPAWFNEGLASLYEQCREVDGHIAGLTNWRLAGLQQAIQDDSLQTLHDLCHTTTQQFYSGNAANYAQARYLCYYLQQENKLQQFYARFRESVADDPSGYDTLVSVLGDPDMSEFEQHWRRCVLRLRFNN